jgi:hypothetical protein
MKLITVLYALFEALPTNYKTCIHRVKVDVEGNTELKVEYESIIASITAHVLTYLLGLFNRKLRYINAQQARK